MAWKKVKLSDVCQINPQTGNLPDNFIYIDLESVVAGKLLIEKPISKKNAPSRAQRVLSDGDILYQTVRPYQKNNYFFEKKNDLSYVASTGYAQIKTSQDKKFLYHYLHNEEFTNKVLARCAGTSYPAIAPSELAKIIITIPTDITEQKRIAKILSTCDEVIFNTQKIIKKYKAVKQGLMQDLFSRGLTEDGKLRPTYKEAPELYKQSELGVIPKDWEVNSLSNVTTYVDYRGKTPFKTSNGIQLITAKNVKDGYIDYNISREYIEKDKYESVMTRGLPRIGDVLFTTEAPVGNVAQINIENIALAQRIIKFRGNSEKIHNKYLLYSFLSDYFRRILLAESTGSTAQGIKGSRLHQLKIKIPSFNEQQAISKRLSKIDSLIQKEESILSKYRKIKTGLMDKLLSN